MRKEMTRKVKTRLFGKPVYHQDNERNTIRLEISADDIDSATTVIESDVYSQIVSFTHSEIAQEIVKDRDFDKFINEISRILVINFTTFGDDSKEEITDKWYYLTVWLAGAVVVAGFQVAVVAEAGVVPLSDPNKKESSQLQYNSLPTEKKLLVDSIIGASSIAGGREFTSELINYMVTNDFLENV